MSRLLFINHSRFRCGVQQFGKITADVLCKSKVFECIYIEIESPHELFDSIHTFNPSCILYNYHNQTLAWLTEEIISSIPINQLAITGHDHFCNFPSLKLLINPDPTFTETDRIKKIGRIILNYENPEPMPEIPTIGSFGFAFPQKGFFKVIQLVNQQFEHARIRLHLACSDFCDPYGSLATQTGLLCRSMAKSGIDIEITHDFLEVPDLIRWLRQNSVNLFNYDEMQGRGISSVIDFALAARRAIAISKCDMFRHILTEPTICIENRTLPEIIEQGIEPLQQFYVQWNETKVLQDYEKLLNPYF